MSKFRHDWVKALDPPGQPDRTWQCQVCGLKGRLDKLKAFSCKKRLSKKEGEEALLSELKYDI